MSQFDALERDVLDVLRLIRSWRNRIVPINKIPSEILALIPDFWNLHERDEDIIALTHVCRDWREVFTSRSSLWANFDCEDADKTLVYLERSKSSPINLSLCRINALSPCDPFFQIIPHAIGRLRSLYFKGKPIHLQDITAHLSHPAPLLEKLWIHAGYGTVRHRYPVLTSALFNGDLSSLRGLSLETVRTELPWRNMVNLTSFALARALPGDVSVRQLLDFFESAPRLRNVKLHFATPTSGTQDGRLVSLACLKRMKIIGRDPSSILLNHLLIPIGAKLTTQVNPAGPLIEDHLPRALDNLRNFPNFTAIKLYGYKSYSCVKFSGPNGQVAMIPGLPELDGVHLLLKSLTQFDTSKTERLKIDYDLSPPGDSLHQVLLPMKDLRTLTLHLWTDTHIFIRALDPNRGSSRVTICPKLEELVIVFFDTVFDINDVVEMAAARASRGGKLKSVRIINRSEFLHWQIDVLGLKKHVLYVEYGPEVDKTASDSNVSDDSDEED